MSQNPRTIEDVELDTDSALNRAVVLLKEAKDFRERKLPPPDMRSGEDTLWQILERLWVATFRLDRALKAPDSIIVLSGKTRDDYPEYVRRNDLMFKAKILLIRCNLIMDDVVELNELDVPGKDLSSIREIIELLKKHIPVMKNTLKRF
ncbi:hypothetical protein NCS52_00410600 [Fusarium sp. LHS14.1]|nr:hypothetical protein NCS52_00410600 [Fusarium sp. LHS14.1]